MIIDQIHDRQQIDRVTAYDVARLWGFLTLIEVALLQEYAQKIQPNGLVINIGAGSGTSGLAFLQSRDDIRVVTIDISPEGYGSLRGEENALRSAGLWKVGHHRQILGHSAIVGQTWDGDHPDLVFIDADHSQEGCLRDIEAWSQNVRPEGYILLHDYDSPNWPGVRQAAALSLDVWPEWDLVEIVRTIAVYRRKP